MKLTLLGIAIPSVLFGAACGQPTPDVQPEYLAVVAARFASADAAANQAGHDQAASGGQELAQANGDIVHQVYLGLADPQQFLAVDVWTSLEGMNTFYSDPNVQASFAALFEAPPDIGVYEAPSGWTTWGELNPVANSYLVHVDGMLAAGTDDEQRSTHNEVAAAGQEAATSLGDYAHLVFLDTENPDRFLAIDLWSDLDGLNTYFNDPNVQAAFATLFSAPPTLGIYTTTDYHQW